MGVNTTREAVNFGLLVVVSCLLADFAMTKLVITLWTGKA
jgi:hypothetical protein